MNKENRVIKELEEYGLSIQNTKNAISSFTGVDVDCIEFNKVNDTYNLNIKTRLRPAEDEFLSEWYKDKTEDELKKLDENTSVRFNFEIKKFETEEEASEFEMGLVQQAVKEIEAVDKQFLSNDRIQEYINKNWKNIYTEEDLEKDLEELFGKDKIKKVKISELNSGNSIKYVVYFKDGTQKSSTALITYFKYVTTRFPEDAFSFMEQEFKANISKSVKEQMLKYKEEKGDKK